MTHDLIKDKERLILFKPCTEKMMVSQWDPQWIRISRMYFYVILKNSDSWNATSDILPKVSRRYAVKDML